MSDMYLAVFVLVSLSELYFSSQMLDASEGRPSEVSDDEGTGLSCTYPPFNKGESIAGSFYYFMFRRGILLFQKIK